MAWGDSIVCAYLSKQSLPEGFLPGFLRIDIPCGQEVSHP